MDDYNQIYQRSKFYWLGRALVMWVGGFIGFMLIDYLSVGLKVDSVITAFFAVGVIIILNAIFWPILSRVFLPFMVFTVGVGALLLNGFLIWLASNFVDGFTVDGAALILTPIGMAAITTLLSAILTIDDDANYYRNVIRKNIKGNGRKSDKIGTIFLEIDGLSKKILEDAIERGAMPTLKGWLEEGTHKLIGWETDLSSQTGASQAGILHGNNHNIPAFRWVEKCHDNKIMVSTGFSDAPIIEKRISDGNGILARKGASRSNLFSGDADDVIFTYSKLKDLNSFYSHAWFYVYSNPTNFSRIIALFLWDVVLDFLSQFYHYIRDIRPRVKRGLIYPFVRAGANVFLREITTAVLIGDILEGDIDVAYVTYLGYDEIAHHSGIRDWDAFYALKKLDLQFHRLQQAKKYAPRPYQLVVMSDHGQSNGATFLQRYNQSLEDVVRELMPGETRIYSKLSSNEDHFGQTIQDPIENSKRSFISNRDFVIDESRYLFIKTAKTIESTPLARGKILNYLKEYQKDKSTTSKTSAEDAQVIVLASGNLGLIYLTEYEKRLTFEEINAMYPQLIPGLVNHEGVGFVMVLSEEHGPLAIGAGGVNYLQEGTIEGNDPLAIYGPRAGKHLLRSNSFKYTPDILVNSVYDEKKDEVAAFEELVGSHGGLGGDQTKPFILHPSSWNINNHIIGAQELYKIFKNELEKKV